MSRKKNGNLAISPAHNKCLFRSGSPLRQKKYQDSESKEEHQERIFLRDGLVYYFLEAVDI